MSTILTKDPSLAPRPKKRDTSLLVDPTPSVKPPPRANERRSHLRIPLTAAATATDLGTGTRMNARTTDISTKGCYVDTMNPFPVGTTMQLRLTKNGETFRANATVAYSQLGVGMGVIFTTAAPDQLAALEKWINESNGAETSTPQSIEKQDRINTDTSSKNQTHYALEELLILLMRKGLLEDEEANPILKRLINDPEFDSTESEQESILTT
jgi:PilZ domain